MKGEEWRRTPWMGRKGEGEGDVIVRVCHESAYRTEVRSRRERT